MNSQTALTDTGVDDQEKCLASENKLVRRPDLSLYEIDDELLIYDQASGDTHRLNGTARFIWDRCDGLRDIGAVAADLADVYDVPVSEALVHVESFFAGLRERRLLVPTD